MIGHYLLTLTPDQEDRVLTKRFEPRFEEVRDKWGLSNLDRYRLSCGCLMLTITQDKNAFGPSIGGDAAHGSVGCLYESLCGRFGPRRVNTAIRTRILSNRARRALSSVHVHEEELQTV